MRARNKVFQLSCLRQQFFWWRCCALLLSVSYGVLFVFASACLATGVFHAEAHHHAEPHRHHDDEADHRPGLADICDFAFQTLRTTEWQARLVPGIVLAANPTPAPVAIPAPATALALSAAIRAPPAPLPSMTYVTLLSTVCGA